MCNCKIHPTIPWLVFAILEIVGCRESEPAATSSAPDTTNQGFMRLDESQQKRLGIEVASVRSVTVRERIAAVGWLMAPPASETIIRAPVAGFITTSPNERWPVLGQEVTAGEKFARVNVFLSPQEIAQLVQAKEETDTQIQQSLVSMQLSEAQLKLVTNARDAVTGVRIDQVKEAYERAKAAYREAQDKLPFLIQEPYEDGVLLKPVSIELPRAGRLLQIHVSPKQFVQAGDPLWTVADWSTLWLRVPVFENDLQRVDRTSLANVAGLKHGEVITGEPLSIPAETKAATRTVDLYYSIPNANWTYRVGQSSQVALPVGEDRESLVIPRSAVLYDGFGQAYCYASEDATNFQRKRIELGTRHQEGVVVLRGLDADDSVVSVGAELLYAEEFKGSLAAEDND